MGESPVDTGLKVFLISVLIINIIVDIYALYMCFLAYKMLKYEAFKGHLSGGGGGGGNIQMDRKQPDENDDDPRFNAFKGKGLQIG